MQNPTDAGAHDTRAVSQEIELFVMARVRMKPHHHGLDMRGGLGQAGVGSQQVSSAEIDLISQRDRDRTPWTCMLELAIESDDRLHVALGSRRQRDHGRSAAKHSRSHTAGKAAKTRVRANHRLNRKTEWASVVRPCDGNVLQILQQCGAAKPGHPPAGLHNVVALERAHGYDVDARYRELSRELLKFFGDLREYVLAALDQVHLVDRGDHVLNTEKRGDAGMPPGLRQYAASGIDQADGGMRVGGAGRTVTRGLLVAQRIGGVRS